MAGEREEPGGADEPDGGVVFYEIARWRLEEQLSRIKALDNKLAATFTLNAAVVALFGAAIALAERDFPYYVWALAAAVLGVFLVNLVFAYRAYGQKEWSVRPDLAELERLIGAHADGEIREWAAREAMTSLQRNEPLLQQKELDAQFAFAAAILDAALVGFTAMAATAPFA